MEPYTHDVQVRRDGVVDHALILFTTVSCEINLFTYPFVSGSCPVAINGWTEKGKTEIPELVVKQTEAIFFRQRLLLSHFL